jgi:hypothetical protein
MDGKMIAIYAGFLGDSESLYQVVDAAELYSASDLAASKVETKSR